MVTRGDDVLLVRRRNPPDAGLWGYPGGHVEWGETAGQAACRELLEETGITATPAKVLTGLDVIGPDHHFHLVAVACRYLTGTPEGRDDVHEAAWVPAADIRAGRLPLSRDVDTVLDLAFR